MLGGRVMDVKLLFFPDFKMANILRIFCVIFLSYLEVVVAPKTFITLTFRKTWKIYSASL